MKMKKVLALAMAAVLSVGMLTACGGEATTDTTTDAATTTDTTTTTDTEATDDAAEVTVEDITLKVWCPEEEMEITQQWCDEFQGLHPEYNITWDVAVVGVDESAANLTTDADSAADVFHLPSGSIPELTEAGYLLPIAYDVENVKSLYGAGAIEA